MERSTEKPVSGGRSSGRMKVKPAVARARRRSDTRGEKC